MRKRFVVAAVITGLLTVLGFMGLIPDVPRLPTFAARRTPDPSPPADTPPETGVATANPEPQYRPTLVGDTLYATENTFLCIDDAAYDSMMAAVQAKDRVGIIELTAQGRIATVHRGTRLLLLKRGGDTFWVRVQDGPHALQTGWVLRQHVRKL